MKVQSVPTVVTVNDIKQFSIAYEVRDSSHRYFHCTIKLIDKRILDDYLRCTDVCRIMQDLQLSKISCDTTTDERLTRSLDYIKGMNKKEIDEEKSHETLTRIFNNPKMNITKESFCYVS